MTADSDQRPTGPRAAAPYRYAEQMTAPPAAPANEVSQMTFEHVYEVDPRLMERHVLQQTFPNWETLRIMRSRHDHLDWVHKHWCAVVISGEEILTALEAVDEAGGADSSKA